MCIRDRYQRRVHGIIKKEMEFLIVILRLIELLWCVVMPICGSLHLISLKYAEENRSKQDLFKHWCYYWIFFVSFAVLTGSLYFLPCTINKFMTFIRIGALSFLATPVHGYTISLFELILSKSEKMIHIKNIAVDFVLDKAGIKKKTEQSSHFISQ
eukprot:TRINITY_DN2309_c0_g1_i5.p2 TRINITY_DN2309_c0_g1~~TRINITY_DN2309_c0_g1_i5.p2  ORF type:complete len:156 (-),score=25.46 TRINITY_DN2309_c0_g1_i5:224-691(-)